MKEPVLCYCEEGWAWFTTCPLDKQWGDDWNDAPYEHNAGLPYEWATYRDVEPYELVKVAWDGPFMLPGHEHLNSPFSVEAINRGDIAWLRPDYYADFKIPIPAGTTLTSFIEIVKTAGGNVYRKV